MAVLHASTKLLFLFVLLFIIRRESKKLAGIYLFIIQDVLSGSFINRFFICFDEGGNNTGNNDVLEVGIHTYTSFLLL